MEPTVLGVIAVALIVGAAVLGRKTGIASVLILLVVGVAIGYLPGFPPIDIPPEWILAGVLPLLLYSSSVNVAFTDFRRNFRAIAGLSVTLVVVTSVAVGFLLYLLMPGLGLAAAIALGAVISPTDAVAATSIAKRLGLPSRLVAVLEGESLVNDASALVLLRSAVAATAGAVSLWEVAGDFVYASALGVGIGLVVGFVTVWIRARISEPVVTTTISFAIPFIAFVPAEHFGASGVIAVVAAGLVTGHRGASRFAANQRISDHTNWATVQFILEHAVFLLMGLELHALIEDVSGEEGGVPFALLLGLILTALVVVIRFLFVFLQMAYLRRSERRRVERGDLHRDSFRDRIEAAPAETERQIRRKSGVLRRLRKHEADSDFYRSEGLEWRESFVISWAGMRGVVTLAAAQSLPPSIPFRSTMILVAFIVAIVTLLGMGGTLPAVIRKTRISGGGEEARQAETHELLDAVNRAAVAVLDDPEQTVIDGIPADPAVVAGLRRRYQRAAAVELAEDSASEIDALSQMRILDERMRQTARAELLDARALGSYSSEAITAVQRVLDIEESRFDAL
ncbi:cation:proton antiporter [Microterricola viridarii]|uniref:Sodium/proton antiporter, CPA1 family n=1 Tax=Microterricola viridarii TaxID=412690 RepID=A0A1H1LCT7_9MICO|nr:cation:proton antiporter [Microterricola viridarii]SDR72374.1 sodium/proton antiporter, CPA1 family [Microterricola viridarii]